MSPEPKSPPGKLLHDGILGTIVALVAVFLFMALLFPAGSSPDAARRAQAKNDVTQIAYAVNAFEAEYGHLPGTNRGSVSGQVLAALMGNDTNLNPRGLVFLEVDSATTIGQTGLRNGYFINSRER